MRAIGYCRVSTAEQGDSRAGLEAQAETITDYVRARGGQLIDLRHDVASGGSLRKRGELGRTLRDLKAGEADTLVVAKLDRLSRSILDFAGLIEAANQESWSIAAIDIGVDTTTTNGELIANIMIALAQWERRLIGDRTRVALKAVRARGTRLGRKPNITPETMRAMRMLRRSGMSYQRIADRLAEEGVPTAQGGQWHAGTVRKLIGHDHVTAIDTDPLHGVRSEHQTTA